MGGKLWSEAEINQLLAAGTTGMTIEALAERLDRTPLALRVKRQEVARSAGEMNAAEVGEALGIHEATARKWIRRGFLGPYRVLRRNGHRRHRRIWRGNLVDFVGDPLYGWLIEHYCDLAPWLARYRVDRYEYYVDVLWFQQQLEAIGQSTVSNWMIRGIVPAEPLPYRLARGKGKVFVTPRPIGDQMVRLYREGWYPRDCRPLNEELAKELKGFDQAVAMPGRKPYGL
ncbi:MAG: DNA-binding protein [Chloroflexi bacterium]|nr:MAG: DNA-binding protein [Chloroflexota bacterium]